MFAKHVAFHLIYGKVCETVDLSSSGRTTNVMTAVLDDFKSLVRQHGMSDNTIIMNQNKGKNINVMSQWACIHNKPLSLVSSEQSYKE